MGRAFTLIELLVVIAIVAVLAALLFPVFPRPHHSARAEACQSNMKQLGTALVMYLQDYDERSPPAAYVEGTHSVTLPFLLHPYLMNKGVWECPTARKDGVKDETYDGTADDTSTSYGYNGHGLAPGHIGITYSQVREPVDTIALVEADSYLAVPPTLAAALGGTPPVHRHRSGKTPAMINTCWVDGHVKRMKTGKLEELATQENGTVLGAGIDSFRYWNRR